MKLKYNPGLYRRAVDAHRGLSRLRALRLRLMEHTYGRQWSDLITTDDGRILSEYDHALESGMRPLTNNLLRSLVKSIVGRFRYNLSTAEKPDGSGDLTAFREANQINELDSRCLEEFLISGCVIQKLVCERRPGSPLAVWADSICPDDFFVNRFSDPRGADVRIIGHFFRVSLAELKLRFGHGSASRCAMLERCYANSSGFNATDHAAVCHVAEVWSFDIDPASPADDPHWHCRFMAPNGTVLDETRSTLLSGGHPYAFKFYPLTDGKVHPFIEDLIGQQKHINILITMIDHILANSAKGVLLMPMDAIMPESDIRDVSRVWSRPGGVIPVNPAARMMPQEVSVSSGASRDASQLLDAEMKLFQQISGVSGALQGQLQASNVSASLYESQINNSAIALLDIYESFNSFRCVRDSIAAEMINTISH